VKHSLESQARNLADCFVQNLIWATFSLPQRIWVFDLTPGQGQFLNVPARRRRHWVGSLPAGLTGKLFQGNRRLTGRQGSGSDIPTCFCVCAALRKRLAELEQCQDRAVSASAALLMHALALHLIYERLPAGRPVRYVAAGGEAIPTIPTSEISSGRATAKQEDFATCSPAARRFYLPPWVAFDDQGKLLAGSTSQAEDRLASMQGFAAILRLTLAVAPYITADEVYQEKLYGMLGQLVNQGRALARYQTFEMIRRIQQRAAAGSLNRGLSLSLPHFDDQALELRIYDFEIIPAGRVQFAPAFVVIAARREEVNVAQDERLSLSTRNHLLAELRSLERAFETPESTRSGGIRAGLRKPVREAMEREMDPGHPGISTRPSKI
jgi:hypothetical protein